jgi:hypothetical protein
MSDTHVMNMRPPKTGALQEDRPKAPTMSKSSQPPERDMSLSQASPFREPHTVTTLTKRRRISAPTPDVNLCMVSSLPHPTSPCVIARLTDRSHPPISATFQGQGSMYAEPQPSISFPSLSEQQDAPRQAQFAMSPQPFANLIDLNSTHFARLHTLAQICTQQNQPPTTPVEQNNASTQSAKLKRIASCGMNFPPAPRLKSSELKSAMPVRARGSRGKPRGHPATLHSHVEDKLDEHDADTSTAQPALRTRSTRSNKKPGEMHMQLA